MPIATTVIRKVIETAVKGVSKEGKIGDGTLDGPAARREQREQRERGTKEAQEIERRERADRTA